MFDLTTGNAGLALFSGLDPPVDPDRPVRKVDFARLIGVSPGRVSQFVAQGLPVEPDGRIRPESGERWLDERFPNRRRSPPASAHPRPTGVLQGARAEKEAEQVRLLRQEFERRSGRLVDRTVVEKAVFDRAAAERQAWEGWTARAAPELATRCGVSEREAFAALDELVRRQLDELQRTPLDVLQDRHGRGNGLG